MRNYNKVERFVRQEMAKDTTGHGYQHALRVFKNAVEIVAHEKRAGDVNEDVVLTAALIHDCIDKKLFENVDERIELVKNFLVSQNYSQGDIEEIMYIITHISWNKGENVELDSKNAMIVRDADRLDALGAIGIVRVIEFGHSRGDAFYDDENINVEDGKVGFGKATKSTLSHFYEKLLLLKDLMHTDTGKKMAEERHEFMKSFLSQFYNEVSNTVAFTNDKTK